MDMNPQRVRTAEFKTVKRGLDPDEVQSFLTAVADELERAQNQSTAMEARARAAVARLQELSESAASQSEATTAAEPARPVTPSVDQSETISRTLLLAQRTADTTIAEATAEAERLRTAASEEASRTLDSTREMAASLLDEARAEARKVGEEERMSIEGEVNALLARRDFLESDVDHMEQFLVDQRSRLREAANELIELTERIPSGLGDVRRPLLSASDDAGRSDRPVTPAAGVPRERPSDDDPIDDRVDSAGVSTAEIGSEDAADGDEHANDEAAPPSPSLPGRGAVAGTDDDFEVVLFDDDADDDETGGDLWSATTRSADEGGGERASRGDGDDFRFSFGRDD